MTFVIAAEVICFDGKVSYLWSTVCLISFSDWVIPENIHTILQAATWNSKGEGGFLNYITTMRRFVCLKLLKALDVVAWRPSLFLWALLSLVSESISNKFGFIWCEKGDIFVTFFGKTDTNAFPFIWQNCLQSVYTRLNGSCKRLNGLLIRFKKIVSV